MTGGISKARWALALVAAAAIASFPLWSADRTASTGTPVVTLTEGARANLNFTLEDLDGKQVNLADFKGRPILLNFWATYCKPCLVEIPAFIELADKYKDRQFVVLGVSVDDTPEDLRPFAAELKINYPVLLGLGHNELQETYDAAIMIPVTWFIRPDGTIQSRQRGPATKAWFEAEVRTLVGLPPIVESHE